MPFRPREEDVFDSFTGGGWQEWQPSQIESYGGTNYQEPLWQEPEPDYYVPSWQPESQPSSQYIEPMGIGGMNGSELPSAQPTADIWSQLAPRVSPDPYIPETIQPELSWKPTVTGGQYQSATASPASGYGPEMGPFDEGSFPDIPTNTGFTPFGDQFSTDLPAPPTRSQGPLLGPFDTPTGEPPGILPSRGYPADVMQDVGQPQVGGNFLGQNPANIQPRNDIGGIRTRGGGPLYQYTPETEAQDRFNELQRNQPQYRPSLARTIMAGLTGFGSGMAAGQAVQNQPYERETAQWKERLGPAQQAASLERQHNTEQRQAMSQQATAETNRIKAEETVRHNQEVEKLNLLKFQDPDYEYKTEGWEVVGYDPKGIKPPLHTGIDGRAAGQYAIAVLNGENAQRRVNTQQAGANQRRTAADIAAGERNEASIQGRSAVQTQRDQAAMNRLAEAARLKAAEGTDGKPLSPTMQRVQQRTNADNLLIEFPEYRGKNVFVGEGNVNNVRLEQGNLSNEEFEMVKRAVTGISPEARAGGLLGAPPTSIPLPAPAKVGSTMPLTPEGQIPPANPYPPGGTLGGGTPTTVVHEGKSYTSPRPGLVLVQKLATGELGWVPPEQATRPGVRRIQ